MSKMIASNTPASSYAGGLISLFEDDSEITVDYDDSNQSSQIINIKIKNEEKAKALKFLLNNNKQFDNVNLYIKVFYQNEEIIETENYELKNAFELAFERNPAFLYCLEQKTIYNSTLLYVVFKCEVVQYFVNSNEDIYGNINTLYQDIAKKIFKFNVYYCTDLSRENSSQPDVPIY